MATCTYQEEPPWLDYPTVRHAKRWPSLDLVGEGMHAQSMAAHRALIHITTFGGMPGSYTLSIETKGTFVLAPRRSFC